MAAPKKKKKREIQTLYFHAPERLTLILKSWWLLFLVYLQHSHHHDSRYMSVYLSTAVFPLYAQHSAIIKAEVSDEDALHQPVERFDTLLKGTSTVLWKCPNSPSCNQPTLKFPVCYWDLYQKPWNCSPVPTWGTAASKVGHVASLFQIEGKSSS